mgnify:FL=1
MSPDGRISDDYTLLTVFVLTLPVFSKDAE